MLYALALEEKKPTTPENKHRAQKTAYQAKQKRQGRTGADGTVMGIYGKALLTLLCRFSGKAELHLGNGGEG